MLYETHCSSCGQPNPPMFDGRFTDCCDEPACAGTARQRWAYGDMASRREDGELYACCAANAESKTVGRGTLLRRVALW